MRGNAILNLLHADIFSQENKLRLRTKSLKGTLLLLYNIIYVYFVLSLAMN